MDNMTQQTDQPEEQATKLLQVQIPPDLVKRLRVAAVVRETNASQIISDLIATHLPAVPDAAESAS
jgi:hypothetical protein